MMNWTSKKLGDLISIKHGFAFKGEYFCDYETENILLTPGNFNIGGGFKDDKPKYYEGPILNDYILKNGDLVVTMTDLSKKGDTLGYPALVPNNSKIKYLHNQRIGLIERKTVDIDLLFLFYLLRTNAYQKFIVGSASGATVRHTSPKKICDYVVKIPDSLSQVKIASVLAAYDDLIENNEKRIKILEEMAQLLYTEWFVKFKFPGHEKVRMVDSGTEYRMIPEGWEINKFGKIIELAYGKALKEENRIEGNILVYGSSGLVGTHNEKLVNGPGIVVGRKGNAGAVHWVDDDFYPIDTTYYVKSNLDLHFIYYLLKNHGFVMGDVAVPGLNRNQTYLSTVLLPPSPLIGAFSARVKHVFNLMSSLSKKNLRLKKMRDLLIPQLVTGKRLLKN